MTRCWSCEKQVEATMFCGACKALLPPPATDDPFAILGLAARFALDLPAAEARYKDLARATHPDKFVRADPRARRAAVAWTALLNQAWRELRDPFRRADRLLRLLGGGGAPSPAAPPALLGDMIERGEAMADARAHGDGATIAAITRTAEEHIVAGMEAVAAGLDGSERAGLERAATALMEVRYWRRLLGEAEL